MKHLFTCALFFSATFLSAQTPSETPSSEKHGKLEQSDYQLGVFVNVYEPQLVDYSILNTLIINPSDLNLPADIDSFTRRPDSQEGSQSTASVVLSTAFSPYSKRKEGFNKQQLFRVALAFRDVNTYESSYNRTENNLIDSISVSRDYFVNANQKVLGVETMYTFGTDAEKPVHVFAGIGLSAGFTVSSTLEINSNKTNINKKVDGLNATTFIPSSTSVKGKNAVYYGAFIPVGLHARVKKNFGILAEVRYGIYSANSSDGGPQFSRNSIFAGIGLRYSFGVFESKGPATY